MVTAIRRVITSIDEFVDPVATAHMSPMVLQPDAMRAELITVDLPGVIVTTGDYSFPVATRGEALADRVALLMPSQRIPSAHVNGQPVAPGVAHAFGREAEVAAATAGPVQFATVSFSPEVLLSAAQALRVEIDLPDRYEFRPVRGPTPARLNGLMLDMRRFVRDTGKPALRVEETAAVARALVGIGVGCFAADRGQTRLLPQARLNSLRIVRACEEYAAASHYQSVTLAELCRASDVSERRVRHAFYQCYGMSPTAYLRIAALNEVRHALLEESPMPQTVSRVASDHGFWHLSRFAGQYRALFGELPSATFAHRSAVAVG